MQGKMQKEKSDPVNATSQELKGIKRNSSSGNYETNSSEFSIQDDEVNSAHWFHAFTSRLIHLDFVVSFNLHILLFIAAALFLLPKDSQKIVNLLGDYSVDPVSFDVIEVSVELPPQEVEWEVDPNEYAEEFNTEDDQALLAEIAESDFGDAAYESLSDGEIELGNGDGEQPGSEMEQEAIAIQEQVVKAGGMSGEVQFSLVWESKTDLDLHVITPIGERIFYKSRVGASRGELDVDRNANSRKLTNEPVENVRWLEGDPISGRYTVWVHLFRGRNENSTDFKLMSKTGSDVDIQEGQVSQVNGLTVFRYFYFGDDVPQARRDKALKELKELHEKEEKTAKKLLREVRGNGDRQRQKLLAIATNFPHTDAAVEALRRVESEGGK